MKTVMVPAAVSECILSRALLLIGTFCAIIILVVVGNASAQIGQPLSDATLIKKLGNGGYNFYVRHAATDWTQSDNIIAYGDWTSCDPGKVRQLSEKGREDARELGAALRSLGIRLGNVFASPYCRTMETARLMSGQNVESTIDMMNLRSAAFVGGQAAVIARARKRLSLPPAKGVNNLFVAHGNLGHAATGKNLSEGELLIVAPHGNGEFKIEGTTKLADLKQYLGLRD